MNILIAPNAFKHSIDAETAAAAIKKGIEMSGLHANCSLFPIGDGGNGTARLIADKYHAREISTTVTSVAGRAAGTGYYLMDNNKTAVMEMSAATGIHLLREDQLDPLNLNSYGTGEMINDALARGVSRIILGMGGSATVDGGAGILKALGVDFLDKNGDSISFLPSGFLQLAKLDLSGIDKRIFGCEVIVLCDVKNPLLGKEGAARVFGPQKGADEKTIHELEIRLAHFSYILKQQLDIDVKEIPHGGAAGGTAAGLHAVLNAKLVNGIDYFLDVTGFNEALLKTDVLITGEGSIDEQTISGKAPFGVARRAKQQNIIVIGLAGSVPLMPNAQMQAYFDSLFPINKGLDELKESLALTTVNLTRTSAQLGKLISRISAINISFNQLNNVW